MTTTTTGHTLTIDAATLTMSIAGDIDTMDSIPDAELAAAAAAEKLAWTGEAIDATTYRLAETCFCHGCGERVARGSNEANGESYCDGCA